MEVARIQFEGLNIEELTNYQNYLQDHLDEVHHQIQLQDDHPPPDQFDDQPYSDEEINQQAINLGEPYFTDDPDEECYNDCGVDYRHSVSECPQNGWDEEDEQIQHINFHGSYITDDPDEECFNNCGEDYRHSVAECPINNPPYEDY